MLPGLIAIWVCPVITLSLIGEICSRINEKEAVMFAPWQESYATGNPVLDTQHRKLIDMVEDLHRAFELGKSPETQLAILEEFISYLDIHENFELQLYPPQRTEQRTQHQMEHEKMHGLFHDLLKRTQQGGTGFHLQDIEDIRDILVDHICAEVTEFTTF